MLEVQIRQAATVVLQSAIRIAPPHTREWGRAMMGELDYVEGPWAGAMWALGSSSVLAKQAIVSLIIPSRAGQDFIPDGGLFARSAALRKAALAIAGACVLTGLLFFVAPPFRQAFDVALKPWRGTPGNVQPGFEDVAKRAEMRHDSEGLAICAVRLQNSGQSARLADEATRLNPNLLWIYAIVALRHPQLRETGAWLEKLQRFDPQNALFPLIKAESIERADLHPGKTSALTPQQQHSWQTAMTAAFQCPRFDDYLDRVAQLNRRVLPRYAFYDPYEVESREQFDLPAAVLADTQRFADLVLRSGAALEAKGDRKAGRDKYWSVARFGQLIDSQGRTGREHAMGTTLQAMAYNRLQASFEEEGNTAEAALFGYLAAKFDPVRGTQPVGESAFGRDVSKRNAAVVEISGLMILFFSGLLIIAVAVLGVSSRHRPQPGGQRARPVATIVVLTSAMGLLFSSVTLYLTYRPYWYLFQTAIFNGDGVESRDLHEFLISTQTLPSVPHRLNVFLDALFYSGSPGLLFYVWAGVTLLGVIGLALIFLRHLMGRPPAKAP